MEAIDFSALSVTLQVVLDHMASNWKFLALFPENKNLQLNRLKSALKTISGFLEDAVKNKQSGGTSPAVESWFNSLKHQVYQMDDLLDEINTERLRIGQQNSKGKLSDTGFRDELIGELCLRLEEICEALEEKVQQIGDLGGYNSVIIQSQIFGRDAEKEKIIQMVLFGQGGTGISVIPIVGTGGVGKTTLAQLVYNDERVKNQFDTGAWVCVSQEFDLYRITKDLLMEVNSLVVDEKDDLNRLQDKLKTSLARRRFIIILDNIWDENYNDYQSLMATLNSGSQGSKIIVTTRNENIARMMQNEPFLCLHPIPNEESWSLFKLHASFDNRDPHLSHEFEEIGKKIVEMCKGLPLAIKTVAGALSSKRDIHEWRDILSSDNWMVVGDILPSLSLSYKLLPSHLKCCFAFCALFPKDVSFDKDEVALLWMANDLVQPSSEKVAQNYFEELRSRGFFEMVNNNRYVMHDLVNDLARIVGRNFCARIEDYQLENDVQRDVLHFSYLSSSYDTLKRFRGLAQVQGLRTFLPIHQYENYACITRLFFSDILPKLQHLRAVSLHQYGISVIPGSIGDLKHLRFLNLAGSYIEKLPNEITQCLNLQTLILSDCFLLEELPKDMGLLINLQHLDISACYNLKKLPEDMGLLINLQHLDISACYNLKKLPEDMGLLINLQHLDISRCRMLNELPEDMGLLVSLQHLDVRGVGFNFIHKMKSWLDKLKHIQNLYVVVNEIHGSALEQLDKLVLGELLVIYGLENAVTVEMARNADLKNKSSIENLSLEWSGIPENLTLELNILAELKPHTKIRQLSIKGYSGESFPNWLGDPSFCYIESLTLEDCKNCIHLPPLGQLSGLKRLEISGMDGITEIGEEFYGNSCICKPFQVLEALTFSNMPEWTTWNTHPLNAELLSLEEFQLTYCPKLVGDIPYHLPCLTTLVLKGLYSIPSKRSSNQEAKSSRLNRIRNLEISDCKNLNFTFRSSDVNPIPMESQRFSREKQ